ncbi:MAG: hypothetical protein HY023_13340 [Chloroflexi bacterium]|nr:hypothetical protein [Chloroflexota bacterium]
MIVFWLALFLIALLYLERRVHVSIERIGQYFFAWPEKALIFHAAISALAVPGVALHELAHWITALLVGIPTGRFSLTPERQPGGSLRLGYVEVGRADPLRESLVGIAPLLFGAAAVIVIGGFALRAEFNVGELAAALAALDAGAAWRAATASLSLSSILWLYLLFAIANSMMLSPSDRRAWLPAAFILIVVAAGMYALGAGAAVLGLVAGPLLAGMTALATTWTAAATLNAMLWPLLALAERQAEV